MSWGVKRYFESLGHGVKMVRIRVSNTEIDGEAVGLSGGKIAVEIKMPSDDLAQGLGQLAEAQVSKWIKDQILHKSSPKKSGKNFWEERRSEIPKNRIAKLFFDEDLLHVDCLEFGQAFFEHSDFILLLSIGCFT